MLIWTVFVVIFLIIAQPLKFVLPVSIRLKSVTNIEKITKSMKMVAAAKYQIAERELKPARTYGSGAQGMSVNL